MITSRYQSWGHNGQVQTVLRQAAPANEQTKRQGVFFPFLFTHSLLIADNGIVRLRRAAVDEHVKEREGEEAGDAGEDQQRRVLHAEEANEFAHKREREG